MIELGLIVPGMPQPLLAPDQNKGWGQIRAAFESARVQIEQADPDLLLIFSTGWVSIIGHQIQTRPEPEWVHVDPDWHELGSIPYKFRMDAQFGELWNQFSQERGLHCRTVAYHGFPIDTGTIVALKLLNPDNRIPASVVSCNMYSDRAETLVLGKATHDAVEASGKKVVAIAVTALTDRMHTTPIDPVDDHLSSLKDDEWNRKLLELLDEGRLEDVCQLARTFTAQAHADSKLKAFWWLGAAMGQHNRYRGEVKAYAPIQGTGGAVVSLVPSEHTTGGHEFDEADVETYQGDRAVLGGLDSGGAGPAPMDED